jgi:hypothetical protein
MIPTNIIKVGKDVQHWPDRTPKYKQCTVKSRETDKVYERDIANVIIALSNELNKQFPNSIPVTLLTAIEDYGQYKYEQGAVDATCDE